jgi:CheY-like chemotaxis protein
MLKAMATESAPDRDRNDDHTHGHNGHNHGHSSERSSERSEERSRNQGLRQSHPLFKILVVEDNTTNQKVILRQLQSLGYEADLAVHGQAAVDLTAQTFYAMVLMDCRLPRLDGYQATQLIRQREQQTQQHPKAIIIALTANDEPEAETEAIAAGMDDFLAKPLRRETLATTLERWHQYFLENALESRSNSSINQPVQRQDRDQIAMPDQPDQLPESQQLTQPNQPDSGQLSQFRLELALQQLQFDLEQLHQLSDQNLEFEQELLRLYLDDTHAQLPALRQAIDTQNLRQIEQLAHHIKGSSASVGASPLEQLAEALEQHTKRVQQSQTELKPEIMTQLEGQIIQKFEQVQLHINRLL